jgi:hypothetical protein
MGFHGIDMKPTIGQIVHYRPNGPDNHIYAALINGIRDNGYVDLWVFAPNSPYQMTNARMVNGPREAAQGTWWWPERL